MPPILTPTISPSRLRTAPPLQDGDHLSADEFERRWEAMPGLKKAELIEGIVHMAAALSVDAHGVPHFVITTWLGTYALATPGVFGADNATIRLDQLNRPQPDDFLCIRESHGGQSKIVDGYLSGAPELVFEVSGSSANYDSHEKLALYRRFGVKEYVIWRVYDNAVDWYVLRGGDYSPLPGDPLLRSETFPGLWLNVQALIAADYAAVLKTAAAGVADAAHAEFVKRLAEEQARRANA